MAQHVHLSQLINRFSNVLVHQGSTGASGNLKLAKPGAKATRWRCSGAAARTRHSTGHARTIENTLSSVFDVSTLRCAGARLTSI